MFDFCNHMYNGPECQRCKERQEINKHNLNFVLNNSNIVMYSPKFCESSKMATENDIQKQFQELFGENEQISNKSGNPVNPAETTTPPQPPKRAYTYAQTKAVCEIFEEKLSKKFWINLSREKQEEEKAHPSETEYYRAGFCNYNGFPLMNIIRYFPNPNDRRKSKSFTTFNLKTLNSTKNSVNQVQLDDTTKAKIKDILKI